MFHGNSSEDLPSDDNSWTYTDNREHQIIAEQHGTQSFGSTNNADVAERRGTISKDPIGASTTHDGLTTRTARENEAATIKGNQGINHGINQSTGRRGRINISGCSRKPMSGGTQLSGEEPKRVTEMDKEVYPARSRSSMIGGDHQRSRATIATILQSTRLSIIFIASTGFVEFIANHHANHSFQVIAFTHFAHKRGKQALTCLPGEPEDINDLSCTLESAFERDILEAYTKLREF